jgi:hypothetical protein
METDRAPETQDRAMPTVTLQEAQSRLIDTHSLADKLSLVSADAHFDPYGITWLW